MRTWTIYLGALLALSYCPTLFAEDCEDARFSGSVNYVPHIYFKDKDSAWVDAKEIGARKKECLNACQSRYRSFQDNISVLWKSKKTANAKNSMIAMGDETHIDRNALFDCRLEQTKRISSKEIPELAEIENLENDLYNLPPSKSASPVKARISSLKKIVDSKGKALTSCPPGLSKTDSVIRDGELIWLCISEKSIAGNEICPSGMKPKVETGLSVPSEEKIGNDTFVFVGITISCSPESCPADSISVGHTCVSCPKETVYDAKESAAARKEGRINGYLCKGNRKKLEALYSEN